MRLARSASCAALLTLTALASACSSPSSEQTGEDDFSSNQATLLDFAFDAELITDSSWNDKQTIQDQLLYTIGHLNTNRSVGRLDKLELTNIAREEIEGGKIRIKYSAKLPVAWASKTNLPETYDLKLPKDVSHQGLTAFTEKHKHSCVDFGAHDVDTGSMWYYYRPFQRNCELGADEIVAVTARATKGAENSTGKYPEFHKVWEDDKLEVVAVWGKYEDGATSGDAGISAYNNFIRTMKRELSPYNLTSEPANVSDSPGVGGPDVTFNATLPDGKTVKVTALLVDNVRTAGQEFNTRYEALSTTADLITYNGHAGLGANVRALARKGKFVSGKYQMFFMNGCDTFAYVDGSLAQTRARLNPDDPTGTKYMEIITNAMPSFFSSMSNASTQLIKGLLDFQSPKTYDQMFTGVDRSQVIVVTGEEDNVFQPGMPIGGGGGGGGGGDFQPFEETGSVARGEDKAFSYDVPAGQYVIDLDGDNDADLYVRKGAAPTTREYDCRPYKNGSKEQCTVSLDAPGKLFVNVRGYAAQSTFKMNGKKQ